MSILLARKLHTYGKPSVCPQSAMSSSSGLKQSTGWPAPLPAPGPAAAPFKAEMSKRRIWQVDADNDINERHSKSLRFCRRLQPQLFPLPTRQWQVNGLAELSADSKEKSCGSRILISRADDFCQRSCGLELNALRKHPVH